MPIKRPYVVNGLHLSLDAVAICCLIIMLASLVGGSIAGFQQGTKNSLAEISKLKDNAISAEEKYAELENKYIALQKAKPLDPNVVGPMWFSGTNLTEAKIKLCGKK